MGKVSKYNLRTQLYFKNLDGNPFVLTKGQEEIFKIVYEPDIKRGAITAVTQYGKSEIASMALICAAVERKEKILIISPSIKQSSIIMGKVIEHFFDHPYLTGMIEYHGKLEQLRQERSKKRLTTRNDSEIMLLTAEAGTVSKEAKSVMGFGATIVLVDESSLIPDKLFSKILRMVGGTRGKLIQLGNPFEYNHFGRAIDSKRYESITINYHQALVEGRITQEFLDEAREDMSAMDWQIFYECKFPEGGPEDALIPGDWIRNAVDQTGCGGDHKQSGLDVARFGRDKTIYIFRKGGEVLSLEETSKMDTMEVVGWARSFINRDDPETTAVDVIGIGAGVFDRLLELEYDVEDITVGASPSGDGKERFYNLRAEIFWYLRKMFQPDKKGQSQISIPNDAELIKELGEIRYSYSSERKIKIEAKDELKKRLGKSPDKADALALAFMDLTLEEPTLMIA